MSFVTRKQMQKTLTQLAMQAGRQGVQALGRSRVRRAKKGRYYIGKNVGIPPQRRQPLPKMPKSLMTTTTTTRAPNIGQSISNLQQSSSRRETGTESLGSVQYDPANASANQADFNMIFSGTVNPADPGTFPALSAISNQYQRFKTGVLEFVFTPTSPSTTNGSIYMAFTPNPEASDPTTIMDMQAILGCQVGPIYGAQTRMRVPLQSLQQAYNVQTVLKPDVGSEEDAIHLSGKLFVATSGFTANAITVVGTLTCGYVYDFSTRQLTQGSNSVAGVYSYDDTVDNFRLDDALYSGYPLLRKYRGSGIYEVRMPPTRMLCAFRTTGDAEDVTVTLQTSNDATNWTAVTLNQSIQAFSGVAFGIAPPAKFYEITHNGTAGKDLVFHFYFSSLPNRSM